MLLKKHVVTTSTFEQLRRMRKSIFRRTSDFLGGEGDGGIAGYVCERDGCRIRGVISESRVD